MPAASGGAIVGSSFWAGAALGLLAYYGTVRGIKAIASAVPMATFITGLIIGMVKAKRDWK